MCGIAGWSVTEEFADRVDMNRVGRELLLNIEVRGRDATGYAFFDPNGTIQYYKAAVPATKFVARSGVWKSARTAVLHTRAATQGKPSNNKNNHPIVYENFVGVHNGWLFNDDRLFENLKAPRLGEVDSEAIWALLKYGAQEKGLAPWEVLDQLQGAAAIAWLDSEYRDTLFMSRVMDSPLYVANLNDNGFIFASGEWYIKEACKKTGIIDEVSHIGECIEGSYLSMHHGNLNLVQTFDPPLGQSYRRYINNGAWSYDDWDSGDYSWRGTGSTYIGSTYTPINTPANTTIDLGKPGQVEGTLSLPPPSTGPSTALVPTGKKAHAEYDDNHVLQRVIDDETGYEYSNWDDYLDAIEVQRFYNTGEKTHVEWYEANAATDGLIPADMLDINFAIREMPIDVYDELYEPRINEAETAEITSGEFFDLLADIRPGMYVTSDWGKDKVVCQVIACPQTFPDGEWILRMWLGGEWFIAKRDTSRIWRWTPGD